MKKRISHEELLKIVDYSHVELRIAKKLGFRPVQPPDCAYCPKQPAFVHRRPFKRGLPLRSIVAEPSRAPVTEPEPGMIVIDSLNRMALDTETWMPPGRRSAMSTDRASGMIANFRLIYGL